MTLDLFHTEPVKPDHIGECRARLAKLDTERVFIEPTGANITSRIIYTLPVNCEHEVFQRSGPNEFKCREKNCPGIITQNQIIAFLNV